MLDVRKLERPHRSGVLAIAVAYALLYIAVDFTSIGNLGNGTWKDLVVCHLLPMACIDLSHPQVPQEKPKEYHVTSLIYCPTCKVKKHEHECEEVLWPKQVIDNSHRTITCPDFEAYSRWQGKYHGTDFWVMTQEHAAEVIRLSKIIEDSK